MYSLENMNNEDLTKFMLQKVQKHCKDQAEGENFERCELIAKILAAEYSINKHSQIKSDLEKKNKILEDQIQVKETEKIEFEQGDLVSAKEYVKHFDNSEAELSKRFKEQQKMITRCYKNSDQTINNMNTLVEKFEDVSKSLDGIRAESNISLQKESLQLNSITNMIKECVQQDNGLTAQIANAEREATIEKQKLQDINNLIMKQSQLNKEIVEFNTHKIPSLAKNIAKARENVSTLQASIDEKGKTNNDLKNKLNDLQKNIQNERSKQELLVQCREKVEFKSDLLNSFGSILDIESNINMSDLAKSKEYQKEKDKIVNLLNDNKDIKNDLKNMKDLNEDRTKQCNDLKMKTAQGQLTLVTNQNELDSINKNCEEKQAKLKLLNEEIAKTANSIEVYKHDFTSLGATYHDLKAEYKDLLKQMKITEMKSQEATQKSANIPQQKDASLQQEKSDAEDPPKKVNKWLENLPIRFTRSTTKTQKTSSSSSVDSDESMNATKAESPKVTSRDSDIFANLDMDLDDPNILEDNLDYSFSDGNSEYWMDNSFLSLENSK